MKTLLLYPAIGVLLMIPLMALWYLRYRRSQEHALEPASIPNRFPIITAADAARRSFINSWQVTPQYDDRTPVLVMPQHLSGYAPADRSTARRNQQRMYRQWSGERHD